MTTPLTVPTNSLAAARITALGAGLGARTMRQISRMQLEGAILFERVSNAPKLLGDQFLARVYRLAAQRFHLSEWNASILRKLDTIEDFYQQMHTAPRDGGWKCWNGSSSS